MARLVKLDLKLQTMTLPNFITIFRFLLIPVFVGALLYYQQSFSSGRPDSVYWMVAVVAFVVAALSDALDGFIARRFNLRSHLGAIMDPLADKALLVTALVMLSWMDTDLARLPIWFVVLVLSRDLLLVTAIVCLHLFVRNIKIKPHWVGKASTAFQMISISMVLFKFAETWVTVAVVLGGLFTLASIFIYLLRGIHAVSSSGMDRPIAR
jgi:cardiolipin synthase (CMP-forming)